MSIKLTTSAPPPPPPREDTVKLPPFPKSDSHVLTLVAFNYIAEHEFDRKDEATGEEYKKIAPAIEFYFGALVAGQPQFLKTWPQQYSLSDRANYYKYYEALVGKAPEAGSNVSDMLGKFGLGSVAVETKQKRKGGTYQVSKLKTLTPVPSILTGTGTPIEQLKPALDKLLAEQGDSGKTDGPF